MSSVQRPRRPVLAGNGLAGRLVLELLMEAFPSDQILVIAPPDEQRHDWQPSLGAQARLNGLCVIQPGSVNDEDVLAELSEHGPDLLLSVYYTQIFQAELLGTIAGPSLNFHPSLLPLHRGTAPLIWSIVEGDQTTGVSVHELTRGVDTGDLVYQRRLGIHPDDTGYSLHLKAANLVRASAAALLRSLLSGEGLPTPVEQSGPSSYHSKADPRVNHLDFSASRERVRNTVRALAPPLPGAYAMLDSRRIVFERVEYAQPAGSPRAAGTLQIDRNDQRPLVWAADGPLEICELMVDGDHLPGQALAGALGVVDGRVFR